MRHSGEAFQARGAMRPALPWCHESRGWRMSNFWFVMHVHVQMILGNLSQMSAAAVLCCLAAAEGRTLLIT